MLIAAVLQKAVSDINQVDLSTALEKIEQKLRSVGHDSFDASKQ